MPALKYNPIRVEKIIKLLKYGEYTTKEICDMVGISNTTFNYWINRKPVFAEKVRIARHIIVEEKGIYVNRARYYRQIKRFRDKL